MPINIHSNLCPRYCFVFFDLWSHYNRANKRGKRQLALQLGFQWKLYEVLDKLLAFISQ